MDCWKAYDCLADEGFQHEMVNFSRNFDPSTDALPEIFNRKSTE